MTAYKKSYRCDGIIVMVTVKNDWDLYWHDSANEKMTNIKRSIRYFDALYYRESMWSKEDRPNLFKLLDVWWTWTI